ncbi:MAG: DUF1801 domain-containing protein [Leptospiraceae bacterium]|nr:DUF1801 domain-containing protein [Leptospiraceae bacterium]
MKTPKEYLDKLPDDRKKIISRLRSVLKKNLPKGFKEVINYGMIGYVVPHSKYPAGYHCNPKDPLPFINLASQKNHISIYHMGFYKGDLLKWFLAEWKKINKKKPDMGKCCIRFKNMEEIPLELIGELATKLTPDDWIRIYENQMKR